MPPPARRETRLYPSPQDGISNLQQLQANFDQFKRKHINQNRDIIKTNALGQLRMRELESRIHALESDKADQALEVVQLTAKVRRLEHAHASVRQGWEIMAQGMKALAFSSNGTGDGGLSNGWTLDASSTGLYGLGLGVESREAVLPDRQKSARIYLDQSTLPSGVVRSIARPPGAHIIDVMEGEESEEEVDDQEDQGQDQSRVWSQSQMEREDETVRIIASDGEDEPEEVTPRLDSEPKFHLAWQPEIDDASSNLQPSSDDSASTSHSSESLRKLSEAIASAGGVGLGLNSAQTVGLWQHAPFDAEGAPSPLSSPPLTFDENAFSNANWAIQVSDPSGLSQIHQDAASTSIAASKVKSKARRSSRRHSGLLSAPAPPDTPEETLPSLSRANSMNSLTDFDSLPTDSPFDSEADEDRRSPRRPLDSSPKHQVQEETPGIEVDHLGKGAEKASGKKEKGKRKTLTKKTSMGKVESSTSSEAVTPGERKRKLAVNSPDPNLAADTSHDSFSNSVADEDVGGRSSRRTRKSVNYALPKLNTKMRKPDPVDLVPASATSATSRSATPASTRFTASSGNLSDIRRLHEAQRAEGGPAGTEEDESSDAEMQDGSASASPKEANRRVWGSNSLFREDDEEKEELADPAEHSREVTDQDFEPTTDEDAVGPLKSRQRHSSAESGASSSGSSAVGGSKSSDSSRSRRPSLRRRSETLPARTLTPSKAANSAQDALPQTGSTAKRSTGSAPTLSDSQKSLSSDSVLPSNTVSARAPTPSSAPPAGRPAKERPLSASVSDSGTPLPERPRTYSGKSAAKAGMSSGGSGVTSLGRSALTGSRERVSLHAALTDGLESSLSPTSPVIKNSASDGSLSAPGGTKELSLLGVSHPYASLSTTTVGSLSSADSSGRASPSLSVSSQGSSSGKSQSSFKARSSLAPAITVSRPASIPPRPPNKPSSNSSSSIPSTQDVSSHRINSNKAASTNRQRVQVVIRHAPSSGSMASIRSGSNSSVTSNSTATGREKSHARSPSSPSQQPLPSSSSSSTVSSSSTDGKGATRRANSSSS